MTQTIRTVADVPKFVDDLIAASSDVSAVGDNAYCIIDLDRPEAAAKIAQILKDFGPRDHLYKEIVTCLKARGRCIMIEGAEPYYRDGVVDSTRIIQSDLNTPDKIDDQLGQAKSFREALPELAALFDQD